MYHRTSRVTNPLGIQLFITVKTKLSLFFKGAQYSHEVLVAMGFFPAGVQDETLKEELQRLAS